MLLSFRLYSTVYYANLNSDHTVPILMVHYFNLPADIYYWGQDRIGSLIPLIAQILNKGLHISAIWSESIVHYTILILGFFAIASFFKSDVYKLLFAIVWFLPPYHFIDTILLYAAVAYSFIGIACFFAKKYMQLRKYISLLQQWLLLSGIALCLIIAIWVSDMAMVSCAVLLFVLLLFYIKKNGFNTRLFYKKEFYAVMIGVLLAYGFISFAKSQAPNGLNYATISSFEIVFKSINIFLKSVLDVFLFKINEPFTSVFAYLVLLVFGILFYYFKAVKAIVFSNPVVCFFLLEAVGLFCAIMLSEWTFLNQVPRRYFACTYLSLAIFSLLVLQNIKFNKKYIKAIVLAVLLMGATSGIYNIGWVWPNTLAAKSNTVKQLENLGNIGIIGEYWNSYIYACNNPNKIKATPNHHCQVRNYAMVDSVFKQKDIYIVKDCWLKHFPDTLQQFNRTLFKNGIPIHIADADMCRYRVK